MDRRHTILNRMLIVMASIFALVALMGAASATDYYVATWGDNTAQGNIMHPWQNVSYATQQAVAGDTIYLFDGTWYGERAVFANSGNATHPITITAYNGTPELDGQDTTFQDENYAGLNLGNNNYINVNGLNIHHYGHTIDRLGSYCKISNCVLHDTGSTLPPGQYGGVVVVLSSFDVTHNAIENCTLYNSGWNTIQVSGNHEPPTGSGIPATYITIRNCTIHDSHKHNAIDTFGNLQHVLIEENTFYNNTAGNIYNHHAPDYTENMTMWNNDFNGTGIGVSAINIYDGPAHNVTISNNTFNNFTGEVFAIMSSHDYTIQDNEFYNCQACPRFYGSGSYDILFNRNRISDDSGTYRITSGAIATIRNPLGKKDVGLYGIGSIASPEFDDGTVFTASPSWPSDCSWTPVRYYSDRSNCSMEQNEAWGNRISSVVTYNITIRPTYGHLYDVTVDAWDEASGTYRITASSTEPDNPTWVNLTTKAAYTTYDITRDGKSCAPATTGADGVLRYRYTGEWDGPKTFEFSYASDGADPEPIVTNFRNEPPTQRTVTLRWDCSAPDIDHYTIYQNGAIRDTTVNKYYSATNLAPDTPYTFEVYATNKNGITGDSASITVRTAAEESFGSNTLYIADDVTASKGGYVTVPVMIYDATGVACSGVNLTYNANVVNVIGVTQGDFTTYFGSDDESATDGWVLINTYASETSLTGDVKIADVILKAVGDAGDASPLDMEIIAMADQNGRPVSGTVSNGLFTVVSDTSPPVVADPSASQLIPDDTDGVPSWGETATLNVTVTDESDIAGVTIDLSTISGSPVQPMTHIGNNVWSVTTSASAGTPPQTYHLTVCATDIHGYTNMQESVELVVMRNGDVTGDNDVTRDDVSLMGNYVTYPGQYTISSEFVADVSGDGVLNVVDAMMLANYVANSAQHPIRSVENTC
jgi:hypothetical protein